MTEILIRIMNILQRIRNMQDLNMFAYAVFGVLLVFGIMNCVLGYRLLRFWVMLFGFGVGAVGGALCMYYVDVQDKMYYLGAMVLGGLVLGIIAFLSYKLGIFLLGAGTGMILSIYLLHPTTSFVFFVCILIGIGLGILGLKFCREVLIVVTSLAGGVLTGVSGAKILGLAEMPYGLLISAGAAFLGLLIQFMMNTREDEEEEELDIRRKEAKRKQEEEDYFDELVYEEMQRQEEEQRKLRRKKVPQVDLRAEEAATMEEQELKPQKKRQSVAESVKEEVKEPVETAEETGTKRVRRGKRADTVVDVRVGE